MSYWYMLGMLLGEWQNAQESNDPELCQAAKDRFFAWERAWLG